MLCLTWSFFYSKGYLTDLLISEKKLLRVFSGQQPEEDKKPDKKFTLH